MEVSGTALALAESLNAHLPLEKGQERIESDRYVVWLGGVDHPSYTVVQRLRLAGGNVEATVEEIRALLRERGLSAATWELTGSTTPAGLESKLAGLGMVPDREPNVVGMVLTETLAPPAAVAVRRAETLEDFLAAGDIGAEAFELDEATAAAQRSKAAERLQRDRGSDTRETFLALIDGEPVAFAVAIYVHDCVVLSGGGTRAAARGRGAYRALVAARAEAGRRRGCTTLVTQAGAMSQPILARLGFREVAAIRILVDRFRDRALL